MSGMTKFGADLIQAMSEALAHAQGRDVAGIKVHGVEVGAVDAKAVRKKLDLTQDEMATVLGTSPSGYKKWEQGKSSRVALRAPCFAPWRKEPEAVLRALSSEKETTITLSTVGKGLFLQPGHPPVTLKDRDGADMCALAAITDRMTTSTHGSTNSTGRVEN